MFPLLVLVLSLLGQCLARPAAAPIRRDTDPDNICGAIIAEADQGNIVFFASDAYACLTSVPFHAAVATRFIKYYNTTMQFQSTLAYLKTPPEGYQQPAVDVMDRLQQIQDNINTGFYKNQYAFEVDVQLLVYAMHDSHVVLQAGILSAFSFASPYEISTASVDGKEIPKVYLTDDLIQSRDEGWIPSSIDTINGQATADYLTEFAALNSVGGVEPHADWNQLMANPALDIQGMLSVFGGGGTFYPGDELVFTFENRSIPPLETSWLAIYNSPGPTGPLTTGGDFYNFFVLGFYPASFDPDAITYDNNEDSSDTDEGEDEESMASWYNESFHAYPSNPDIVQDDLSIAGGGILTGYFLHNISTAVLSIPSFDQHGWHVGNFSKTIQDFIIQAKNANLSRVLIDVQQNTGGVIMPAVDTFKQFFPQIDPFMGSRRRSMPMADILGEAKTAYFQTLSESSAEYQSLDGDEWIISDRINAATDKNFTSWSEFRGPVIAHGDSFSQTERYDLKNEGLSEAVFGGWIPYGYGKNNPIQTTQPWNASDIVILTDGLCASACSLFVEMMSFQAGVRTVTIGGGPKFGPMQAVSGNRGARVYSADDLNDDFDWASTTNAAANTTLAILDDSGIYTTYAGINLRDQIRPNESDPLQFKYEAAHCRIYYTLSNIYNMTQQWQDAVRAVWDDNSLCVQGSTGYASFNNRTKVLPPPVPSSMLPTINITVANYAASYGEIEGGGLPNGRSGDRKVETKICAKQADCNPGSECINISVTCSGGQVVNTAACLSLCQNRDGRGSCQGADTICSINNKQANKAAGLGDSAAAERTISSTLRGGYCIPTLGTSDLGCPTRSN